MIKNAMTTHERETLVVATSLTTAAVLVLCPILIPLMILEVAFKSVKAIWFWFFPKPEPKVDETFEKVRAQFRKARRK
jgi:hypothetical protein